MYVKEVVCLKEFFAGLAASRVAAFLLVSYRGSQEMPRFPTIRVGSYYLGYLPEYLLR